jgi:hypothetical protein
MQVAQDSGFARKWVVALDSGFRAQGSWSRR